MITAKYVLANLFLQPLQSKPRSAGFDIRACVSIERLDWDDINRGFSQPVWVNGEIHLASGVCNKVLESICPGRHFVAIKSKQSRIVSVGFKVCLNTNNPNKIATMQIVSRSGLASKCNLTVTNSPGIIDEGYTDWVKVSLTNNSEYTHLISHGTRIAQGLFVEVDEPVGLVVDRFDDEIGRGGGFGSSGNR